MAIGILGGFGLLAKQVVYEYLLGSRTQGSHKPDSHHTPPYSGGLPQAMKDRLNPTSRARWSGLLLSGAILWPEFENIQKAQFFDIFRPLARLVEWEKCSIKLPVHFGWCQKFTGCGERLPP
jgi:hypothetical protein